MKNKVIAVLDRIEGGTAVLLVEDSDSIELPVGLLPPDIKEGDIVSIIFKKEDRKTKNEKERVEGLINKLSSKPRA